MHDDIIKWNHFPRYWPFVRGIHRSPVNSPHIGQWRRALMLSLICVWINGWVYNGEAGDLRRYRAHYDVIVMGYGYPRFHVALLQQSSGHVYLVLQSQRQDLSILTHWVAGIKKIGTFNKQWSTHGLQATLHDNAITDKAECYVF